MQVSVTSQNTITRTDASGKAWTTSFDKPAAAVPFTGSFRAAVQYATSQASAGTNWIGAKFNNAATYGIYGAGDGAYTIGDVGASIHLFNPIDSDKYVAASATKAPGSDLLALVSRSNWVDLRNTDAADAQRLLKVPGTDIVLNH